ncbi:MAG: lipid A biosynthesis lauroyl acyltransferase [Pseudolabrys sp.]|nr:lipid A biosynthesis lauroyl acyltransferase [Pseudolabrys sp.]
MPTLARSLRLHLIDLFDTLSGHVVAGLLRVLRLTNRKAMANLLGVTLRRVGPWLPEHKIGRANLKAAFPEKTDAEIERILDGVWDNLGRVAAEFAHLDRIKTYDPAVAGPSDIEYGPETLERFHQLRLDGKPALLFTAHLANWELTAQVAHTYGLNMIVVYRRPNLGQVADAVMRIRSNSMGELLPTSLSAPVTLARKLAEGRHVGMLVDQYSTRGVDVKFFGRQTKANALIARLARQIECPIHGARIVRLPGDGFYGEITEAIEPVRDAEGKIDVVDTMQVITNVVEGWVRERPEQWLWLHRRWR